MRHSHSWLVPAAITIELPHGSCEDTIDHLIQLLQHTGRVTNAELVKKDILHREEIASTAIIEHVSMPHALTDGVSAFCAAIGIVEHKSIYVLTAWNEHTIRYLERLAALMNILLDETSRTAILACNSAEDVFSLLCKQLAKQHVRC